jgi:hypothetical protein
VDIPDTTVTLTTTGSIGVLLDLDNNSVDDFNIDLFRDVSSTWQEVHCFPNQVLRSSGNQWALAMQNGDYIGNPGDWYQFGALLLYYGVHYGNWFVGDDKCIGIRLSVSSQFHYGWIHVEIVASNSFKVKDYAYQSQPNVPMLACDTTNLATWIHESKSYFNFSQLNNSIHISSFQNLNHANISVYDLLGKEILQQQFEGKETTIKIDKKGIYFVEVKSAKGISRKKIFIY